MNYESLKNDILLYFTILFTTKFMFLINNVKFPYFFLLLISILISLLLYHLIIVVLIKYKKNIIRLNEFFNGQENERTKQKN